MLDTTARIGTPEGIELTLRVAGPVPRALAWVLDVLVRGVLLALIGIIAGLLGQFGTAIMLLSMFLLEWLVPAWFEVNWNGATPGKRAMGLMVLHDDGTPVRWSAALTRNLLRALDFLPAFYFLGWCSMVSNRDFKRLGDFAANTLVVYRDDKPRPLEIPQAPPAAPPHPLPASEQRAILDFAERSARLTPERSAEIAEIAQSLVGRRTGPEATGRLVAIANHLVGRR
ncbi:MAG TPA: RDD family protein [Burkholderiales bacterium]|nr:RDD family protein [Burkholderiales bacterium]